MVRSLLASLAIAATLAANASAQGPLRRAGQALDNAGRNIRQGVENAVDRGQVTANERTLLDRVTLRVNLDRRLVGSAMQIVVQPGGSVILRGSVADDAAKALALDLVQNTVGVARVVDELGVVKEVNVVDPAAPAAPLDAPALGDPLPPLPAAKPIQSEVIEKP